MKVPSNKHRKMGRQPKRHEERGVALITTLLLLLLMTGMTVAMVMSVNSDMLINGYYRSFRGSFYAADSGLAVARLAIYNQIVSNVSTTVASGVSPIASPSTVAANVTTYINSTYGSNVSLTGSGQAAYSWPEKFKITGITMGAPTCIPVGTGVGTTCPSTTGTLTSYKYTFPYTLTSVGSSSGSEQTTLTDTGALIVNVSLTPSGNTKTSFAAWGMFIDQYALCSGGYLVPGTISGPVFTNGGWTFGDTGKYQFTDSVGSVNNKAGFQFSNGTCNQVADQKNGSITPTFQAGFNRGANSIPLPSNDYNQRRAVLDGQGDLATNPTNSEMNSVLRNISKTKYPTGGASSGVYLPYSVDSSGNATFTGGGIYVQGDAKVTLSASGSSAQIYTIVQGTTTTVVTVNNATNTTTMQSGSTTLNITGVPQQFDTSSGAPIQDATMLYVNGNITSLSGTGEGSSAIQDGTLLTITAANNITVTGDIRYKSPPIAMPGDTIISANDKGQALGIFTATGDIQLANTQSSRDLEIDGALATLSTGGSGGIVNTGSSIDTLTIVGGRIQNQIKNIGATTRNVFFDRRFAQNNFGPPWFPSTSITSSGTNSASVDAPIYQRLRWLNQSVYY